MIRTNIERAINDLIVSKKDITLANALPAYLREAGFQEMSHDALTSFEHALEKYPTLTDESRTVILNGISGIMAEYWSSKLPLQCPFCTTCARRLGIQVDTKTVDSGALRLPQPEETKEITKRRLKSKKARRIRQKRKAAARFDPFAPSTSAVTL